MQYRCTKCGHEWDEISARHNEFFCFRSCNSQLVPAAEARQAPTLPGLETLPSILAIPLAEYDAETHPVMKVHRLCDSVEMITRFCSIVALGELRLRLADDPLPEELLKNLPRIERPTFGDWCSMLGAIVTEFDRGDPLVVSELPKFVKDGLLPGLGAEPRLPESNLVELRNRAVHGGPMAQATARELLAVWEPWLGTVVGQLSFLSDCQVCHYAGRTARRLIGGEAAGQELPLRADLLQALESRNLDGHVVLLRQGRWINLWPLCDYGRATTTSLQGVRTSMVDGPLVYIRAQRDRLLYAALGIDLSHGERRDVVSEFRSLFRLDDRVSAASPRSETDYEHEIQTDSQALLGRVHELATAKKAIKETESGVLWITGPGGIGKSFLMAKLADDLLGDPQKGLRIAWRFKASHGQRCSRTAFFQHAITKLAAWLDKGDTVVSPDADKQFGQLRELLEEVAALQAEHRRSRPPRILFVLDGLDEIARLDGDFAEVAFRLSLANVVWLCAGRAEGRLPKMFSPDRCTHVFPTRQHHGQQIDGLPPMSDDDIRGMLVDGTGKLKYELLSLDVEESSDSGISTSEVINAAVEAVICRAEGLPLYVHFVVQDILEGQFRFADLAEKLPPSLSAYYDTLLQRLSIGQLHALLTPLVVMLAWAHAPLDEETLKLLLVRRKVIKEGDPSAALRDGLEAVQSIVRPVHVSGIDRTGYELYHPTFRDHIREDLGGIFGDQNALARDELCELVKDWESLPNGHSARGYVLRHGVAHLLDTKGWDDVECLLTDLLFFEAKNDSGLLFQLADDLASAIDALPNQRPKRKFLVFLNEALRRNSHFIHRHRRDYPQGLFQCIWNECWWCDARDQRNGAEDTSHVKSGPCNVRELLETWRRTKEGKTPDFLWLRSLRPPSVALGGAQREVIPVHGPVMSVAFSPQGNHFAAAIPPNYLGDAGIIEVYDASNGQSLAQLKARDGMTLVAYSSKLDQLIATDLFSIWTWDAVSGRLLTRMRIAHRASNTALVSYCPQSDYLVLSSDGFNAVMWCTCTGRQLPFKLSFEERISALAISRDGLRVATATSDGVISIWDAQCGRELLSIRGAKRHIGAIAFSPNGERVVCGSTLWLDDRCADVSLEVWNTDYAELTIEMRGHLDEVSCVTFSPTGEHIVSGSKDRTVRLWDAESGDELMVFEGHEGIITSVACSPRGNRIVSGSAWDGWEYGNGSIRVWETDLRHYKQSDKGRPGVISSLALSPSGHVLITGSNDSYVRLWNINAAVEPRILRGHTRVVNSVVFHPSGTLFASGSWDCTIKLWDTSSGKQLGELHSLSNTNDIAFSASGNRIIGFGIGAAQIWDVNTLQQIALIDSDNDQLHYWALSPDGDRVAGIGYTKLCIFDVGTGDTLQVLPLGEGGAGTVAFCPTGDRVVGAHGSLVRVWDAHSGRELRIMRGHESAVALVAFSALGNEVISRAYIDGIDDVRVWDYHTGSCVAEIKVAVDFAALVNNSPWLGASQSRETVVWSPNSLNSLCEVLSNILAVLTSEPKHVTVGKHSLRAFFNRYLEMHSCFESKEGLPATARDLARALLLFTKTFAAWYPIPLDRLSMHTNGLVWAGSNGDQVHIFTLEGKAVGPW